MSENIEDIDQEGGERIGELPIPDEDVAGEEGGGSSSLRSPGDDEPVDSDPDEGGEIRSSPPPDPGE